VTVALVRGVYVGGVVAAAVCMGGKGEFKERKGKGREGKGKKGKEG
jgi:hypothetical protein